MGFLMNMNMKRRRDSGNSVRCFDMGDWVVLCGGGVVDLWRNNEMRALEQIS
jgi:hypothetical protein